MRLRKVSGCDDDECPAVYLSDRGTAVIQGERVTEAEGLTLRKGETAVELPPDILLDAVVALAESGSAETVQRLTGGAEVLVAGERLRDRFTGCERSAWRFECQPTYTIAREQENLRRFRAGEPKPAGRNASWHARVRSLVSAGKIIGRVRTVRRPLSEYQRYQLAWGIPGNIEAGEDIRILDLADLDLDLPSHDFWLFDESLVVDLNFRPDGTLIDIDQREDPDLTQYLKWRDTALDNAVPLSEWDART
ncbi:DUF6879 family protein [Saccharopolyspora phatthalungensis]|uniref:DUF6879 domain-containing protein n=1 Tax=Saccharopolyspora phatthalungensis TaxID=664693 RepID=A0A840QDG9_9PSEU|nr:DUF6879 family protein [Saccharopolyspora phatthalungensis]MBB5155003.1 hypothetical protein [Saccharopolyspora phatthalungensis]